MTHAESRARRMRVRAYRDEHPNATDGQLAHALGWTVREVRTCRRAACIPASRAYRTSEAIVAVLRAGPASLRHLCRVVGLKTIAGADYHVRKLRAAGMVVGERTGHQTRWRLVTE